jgi:predicted hotdog family 3-hydroxylacyl-ACP dehydratase
MTFLPIEKYVFHRPPILLLDEVVALREDRAVCRVTVRADHPVLADGVLPPAMLVDMMAQAVLVLYSHITRESGRTRHPAFLAGMKGVEFPAAVRVGDALVVEADLIRNVEQVTVMRTRVLRADRTVAGGEMKFFIDAESAIFPPDVARTFDHDPAA